ncbi:hypothetical protein PAXRUDRAFT_833638, partial [Paxillus rubicundulus Ve08.2h10]
IDELLGQGGISNLGPSDESPSTDADSPDISEHIILIHGDLGTGEQLQTAQLQ